MFLDITIDPLVIPSVAQRERALDWYAKNYVDNACDHETKKEFCEQAAADLKDKTVVLDLMVRINTLERQQRRIAA